MDPSDPTDPKPWYASKTLWLNAVLTVIGLGTFFAEPHNDPVLTVASISAAIAGAGNVVLRVWFTASPIAGTRLAYRALLHRQARANEAAQLAQGSTP